MLDIQSNKEDCKYVGARVTPRIRSYLTLYSLAKGTNKSKIIKELIDSWMLKQRANELDTVLIREVTSRINSQWLTSKVLNTQISFSKFKEIVKEELLEKGLLKSMVDSIMEGIKEK
jgi:hypothetical protein